MPKPYLHKAFSAYKSKENMTRNPTQNGPVSMAHFKARNPWLETPLAATDRAPRPWWRSEWTWICICFGCPCWMLISKQDHFLFSRTKMQIGEHLYPSWNKYTFFKTYIWTTKPIYHNQLNFGHCWRSSTCSKDHVNWPGNLSWFWTTLVELGTKHLESWKLDADSHHIIVLSAFRCSYQ